MKKLKWIIIVLAVLGLAVAVWFWKFKKEEEVVLLETEKVAIGQVTNSVTAIGTLQPVDTVAVGSQISGIILHIYADFNLPVKKGQLLAILDKTIMEAQVQQYNASLKNAKANLVYQTGYYARQNKLLQIGAISTADMELANYSLASAKENVNGIQAQLKTANKNLSFTKIYSPIDGTILSRSISEGQTVAASLNTPTLFSIAKDLSKMQVQASVDEADIGEVKKGQRVVFAVDAFPAEQFNGTVKDIRLRSSISANVVTYITIIDAPNANLKLKPGMTANITVYTKEVGPVLTIPAAALGFTPDSLLVKQFHLDPAILLSKQSSKRQRTGQTNMVASKDTLTSTKGTVWIRKDSLHIYSKSIRVGLSDKTVVQVVSGLDERDELITGYRKVSKSNASSNKTTKSPFVPTRGGGGRRPN